MDVRQEFFNTYQNYLEITKNIFTNHNLEIKLIRNFDHKFNNPNSKGFKFERKIVLSYFLTVIISICIVLPLLIIGAMGFTVFKNTILTTNEIGGISFLLFILGIIFIPLITWILAKLFWRLLLHDYAILSKNIYYLVDTKIINFKQGNGNWTKK